MPETVLRLPQSVVRLRDDLREAIGIEPVVERVSSRRHKITVSSDRVVVTFSFKGNRRRWTHSTLEVDGETRRNARNLEHLAEHFRDPSATLAANVVKLTAPNEASFKEAPPLVKHIFAVVSSRIKDPSVSVKLSRPSSGGWTIGIYVEDNGVELNYGRRRARWGLDLRNPLRLVLDNEDCTDDVNGGLEEALRLLFGGRDSQPKSPGAINGRSAQGVTANSVTVRRATVIRN